MLPLLQLSIRIPISSPHGLDQTLARQANRGANGLTASNTASTTASSTSAGSSSTAAGGGGGGAAGAAYLRADDDWAWETWETIRQLCAHNTRLQIGLDLSYPLPGPVTLARWVAEPVGQLWLPATAYLANAKGFPVLSKAAQGFIRSMLRRAPTVVLSGINNPPPMHARGGAQAYIQYVRHLERTAPPEDAVDQFARGYNDWLQAPLQPLMDNLEGATYEVFERDPVKYAQYEEAVHAALCDRPAGSTTSIWVCGAGRGPLVARCLRAAERAGRAVKLVALEKNPNALVTLQERQALEWGDAVRVLFGDMRTTQPPALAADRADIVVSELLGSFGDNELSPECLDGAMRFLKRKCSCICCFRWHQLMHALLCFPMRSERYFNPFLIHNLHYPTFLVQATFRGSQLVNSESEWRTESSGNPLRCAVPSCGLPCHTRRTRKLGACSRMLELRA